MKFDAFRLVSILVIVFSAAIVFGQENKTYPCDNSVPNGSGQSGSKRSSNGLASDFGYTETRSFEEKTKVYPVGTKPLQIISKPKAFYTEPARKNCIQGVVILQITFYANGRVGNIKVVKGLPYGLSKQAVEVAKRIRFEPAMNGGKSVSVTKKVSYNFTIY